MAHSTGKRNYREKETRHSRKKKKKSKWKKNRDI